MNKYCVTHYNQEGEKINALRCKRVDIVTSHSLYYYDNSDKLVYRVFSSVTSVNLEAGIITVYYLNGSYIIIKKAND